MDVSADLLRGVAARAGFPITICLLTRPEEGAVGANEIENALADAFLDTGKDVSARRCRGAASDCMMGSTQACCASDADGAARSEGKREDADSHSDAVYLAQPPLEGSTDLRIVIDVPLMRR